MSVWETTLIAIGAPLFIALMCFPIILVLKGWKSWRDIPREIYDSHRQQLLGFKPSDFWFASLILNQVGRFLAWLGWETSGEIAQDVSLILLAAVLVYQLFWTIRIIRFRAEIDARLVRFAHYALCGCTVYLLGVAASIAENLTPK